jgi:hypothetical protein
VELIIVGLQLAGQRPWRVSLREDFLIFLLTNPDADYTLKLAAGLFGGAYLDAAHGLTRDLKALASMRKIGSR